MPAVLVTDGSAKSGLDHVDAHRTLLLAAGPYVKRNYVSHTNTSFPGLLRTIFELLHAPPLHLMDATAASLSDLFTDVPDFRTFTATLPDPRIFPARNDRLHFRYTRLESRVPSESERDSSRVYQPNA